MNAEDLRFYIASIGESRRLMHDILNILTTQEQTISDIINHPSYEMSFPPRHVPNYYGNGPRFLRRNLTPTRIRRNYAQSPIARPTRMPPPPQTQTQTFRFPRPPPPPVASTRDTHFDAGSPADEAASADPSPVSSSNIDIMNEPSAGPSNANTPRVSGNRLFGTSIIPPTTGTGLSPTNDNSPTSDGVSAQTNPIASRIADLLGVALMGELGGLSPVTVAPSPTQIRQATELIYYSSLFDPATESEPQYDRCPISHEEFSANSRVYRIRHCGHYFEPSSLLTWFRTSVRCPVCRYDIRTHLDSNHTHSHSVEEYDDPTLEENNEEENDEEIVEENTTGGSSLEDFMAHIRNDQRENPLARNRRRVYRYQFDVTPFVTRALRRGDAEPDPSGNL